jgi:hypothetical protein|uniref:Uncharacterized protein n=1 Tax=Mus musculus TaxID=10090 RepID=Q8BIA5_MOUSE|nr:unnamed protein product [Mus musculus]
MALKGLLTPFFVFVFVFLLLLLLLLFCFLLKFVFHRPELMPNITWLSRTYTMLPALWKNNLLVCTHLFTVYIFCLKLRSLTLKPLCNFLAPFPFCSSELFLTVYELSLYPWIPFVSMYMYIWTWIPVYVHTAMTYIAMCISIACIKTIQSSL